MKRSRLTEEQIIGVLLEHEAGGIAQYWRVPGKASIIEVVDIGATGHFPALASLPRGPLQRAIGREPGSCR